MLWSFGLAVLFVDFWQKLNFPGLDLGNNFNMYGVASAKGTERSIIIVVNNRNVSSDKRHVHVFSAEELNSAKNPGAATAPVRTLNWVENADLGRGSEDREDQSDAPWENNIHNFARAQKSTTTTPRAPVEQEAPLKPFAPFGPTGDDYDEEEAHVLRHSNKPVNRLGSHKRDSRSHKA